MEQKKVLVTSALPYANGPIHLGHLAGAYLPADIFVRFCRLSGRDVLYVGGTDEHGVPITITADKQGITPQQVVDKWYPHIKETFSRAGISFDHFSRTSLPIHHETSQDIFLKLHEQGLMAARTEKQLYDEKLERFLPDRYVEGTCNFCGFQECSGDQCEKCGKPIDPLELKDVRSKLSGTTPVVRETEHLYLKLDKLQPRLEKWLAGKDYWKENVLNFCRGMLADGLRERAVTRDLSWGIPVPLDGFEGKVLYVWFDATIGYISSTREWAEQQGDPELWKKYWWDQENTRLVHFIGKDNIFFHALMFPATLMAYGKYVLPENVPANEYLNLEGLKFSTSRNFAVWLHDYLDRFEPDPLRYYLCSNMPENRDTDFNLREFQAHNNNELADTVGNFINRTLTFVSRYFDGKIPARGQGAKKLGELDEEMLARQEKITAEVGEHIDNFRFRQAADTFGDFARFCNKYFNDKAPWASRKSDIDDCATALNICAHAVYALSVAMYPIMPFSAVKIWRQLGLSDDWHDHPWSQDFSAKLPEGHKIGKVEVLFPKIDDEAVSAQEATYQGNKEQRKEDSAKIALDDFIKVDIRVALVTAAVEIPKSKKLLRLTLDVGELGERTVCAGIKGHYTPEALVGRKVLLCANLAPRTVMGIESRGMVLAAVAGEGKDELLGLTTIDPEADLPPGTRIS
ncbi:MAG: methionine--tRNA ligase [Candidatus Glassbacteria bacterium]|nr:methionine--tRNA ligase [Candidatus Glassbacteria bacterium]